MKVHGVGHCERTEPSSGRVCGFEYSKENEKEMTKNDVP